MELKEGLIIGVLIIIDLLLIGLGAGLLLTPAALAGIILLAVAGTPAGILLLALLAKCLCSCCDFSGDGQGQTTDQQKRMNDFGVQVNKELGPGTAGHGHCGV